MQIAELKAANTKLEKSAAGEGMYQWHDAAICVLGICAASLTNNVFAQIFAVEKASSGDPIQDWVDSLGE